MNTNKCFEDISSVFLHLWISRKIILHLININILFEFVQEQPLQMWITVFFSLSLHPDDQCFNQRWPQIV